MLKTFTALGMSFLLLILVNVTYGEYSSPDGAQYQLEPIVTNLTLPIFLTHAGDGSGRLFIVEQDGKIWISQNGRLLKQPFLDVSTIISRTVSEQGLLGLAFDPRYEQNGHFFINYTDMLGDTIVARYIVSADDPNEADPNSAQPVLRIDQPYSNHNGGHIVFGLDGYLYIGMGDGGSAGDPQGYSQNGQSLLGKLLRLDVSGQAFDQAYVTIPHDNPYIHNSSLAPQVWVLGLRNPWRFSFDRRTGDLYIGDVGENVWEEINFQPADSLGGENYGWNIMEGQQQQAYSDLPVSNDLVAPIVEYRHNMGCAVTGGYVYRGEVLTALQGVYFFSDYCFGTIWSLYRDGNGRWIPDVFMQTHLTVSSFGEDEAGELYVIDHGGTIYQLTSA